MKKKFRFRVGQECRANLPDENGKSWGRARRASTLQYFYSDRDSRDCHPRSRKTWKRRRDKQYHVDGRQQEHRVTLSPDIHEWHLKEYFRKHNIPYRLVAKREKRTRWYWQYEERRVLTHIPQYHMTYVDGQYVRGHQMGFRTEYYWATLETPILKERTYYVTVAYELTWWYNAAIDIEKILATYP